MEPARGYSYYENLGFNKFESWEDADFSQFLVWDFLNSYKETVFGKEIVESFTQSSKIFMEHSRKYRVVSRLIDSVFLKFVLLFEDKGKREILFTSVNFFPVEKEIMKCYSVGFIVKGWREQLFAISNFISYINISSLSQHVFYYLRDGKTEHLRRLVEGIENKLIIINPEYIILTSDQSPIDRVIILVCKKLGITTIEIKHGVDMAHFFNSDTAIGQVIDGKVADYVMVWGKYFKDLYIDSSIRKSEDIYILGYPYPIKKNIKQNTVKGRDLKVCYLAHDYEKYDDKFLTIKLETVKKLFEICKKLGLAFICRPHPGDNRCAFREVLPYINLTSEKESLEETFDKADIFISFCSTSLVEASIHSKIALQLMNYPIETDNFEKLGACNKSFKNIEDLGRYLEKVVGSNSLDEFKIKFNNDYIETRYNVSQRFLEIIKEIEKKKHDKS